LYRETEFSLKLLKNKYQSMTINMEDDVVKLGNSQEVYRAIYHNKILKSNFPKYNKEKGYFYYSYKEITPKSKKIYYINLARNLKLNLYGTNTYGDNTSILSILDEKGDLLGETRGLEISKDFSARNQEYFRKKLLRKDEIFKQNKLKLHTISYIESRKTLSIIAGALVGYNRLISDPKGAIVLTRKIDKTFLDNILREVGINEQSRIFFLNKQKYIIGKLEVNKGYKILDDYMFEKIKKNGPNYYTEENIINGEEYYISYYPLYGIQGDLITILGVASSKKQLRDIKLMTFSLIGGITFLIILISTSLYGKLLEKVVRPLYEIIDISKKVTLGDYEVKLNMEGEGEIKILNQAYKNMIDQIKETQYSLKNKNARLSKNVKILNIIEKISSIIYTEKDITKVLYYVLATLVSAKALNYSRALYFEYDENKKMLLGKLATTNLNLIKENEETDETYEEFINDLQKSWKYVNKDLEKMIDGLKIKCKYNILAKAMLKKEIRYYNEEGKKYEWGSDKLANLGLKNFMIMPISYSDTKYGCIIVDNYRVKKRITIEEVEMLGIFANTLSAYIKNMKLEEENLKKERLSAIGKLASSVVHEIRTPLVGIKGFADILNQKYREDEKARKYTGFIKSEADRLNNLATDLLDYSKDNNYLLEKVEINDIIERSLDVLINSKILVKENIETILEKPVFVYGNKSKLEQVFINLIKNSIESISSEIGNIRITTKQKEDHLEVEIKDNGSGIPKEKLTKIFEPFVTTKIQGTGLGLSIVKEIIAKHNGEIKVKSKLKQGTEIQILLDIYEEEENDRRS